MADSRTIRTTSQGVSITLTVIPRSGRDEIVGLEGDAIKIRLKAPPVEGRANEALLAFLAKRLVVPRAALELVSGATGRHKVVRVTGLTAEDVATRFGL